MKKSKNIVIIGLAAVLLSSCKAYHSLYDEYKRPQVKADSIVRDPLQS